MTEAFKQVFFGLFWFTADVVLISAWTVFLSIVIGKLIKHD